VPAHVRKSVEQTGLSHHSVKIMKKSRQQAVKFVILTLGNNSTVGKTPIILTNWDPEPSGYAENPDNWIFVGK
jgi:hypothetical protein